MAFTGCVDIVGGTQLAVILKLALEISKKTLPTASTFIRAVVVAIEGTVTDSEPSFGVLANTTVG